MFCVALGTSKFSAAIKLLIRLIGIGLIKSSQYQYVLEDNYRMNLPIYSRIFDLGNVFIQLGFFWSFKLNLRELCEVKKVTNKYLLTLHYLFILLKRLNLINNLELFYLYLVF